MNSLAIFNRSLWDLVGLPDPAAAEQLDKRMKALDVVDRIYQVSFVERGIIAQEFQRRALWKHLEDPDTGTPFANMDAWMSCSEFMGCRRTNYEAKRVVTMLEDVPTAKLIDIPKASLHTLAQLSTAVRNQPDILEAAKTMTPEKFVEKVEREQPMQHIESRAPLVLRPGRSDRKAILEWVEYAMTHDIAGNMTEAIVRACEMALDDARLDEELKTMPVPEARA